MPAATKAAPASPGIRHYNANLFLWGIFYPAQPGKFATGKAFNDLLTPSTLRGVQGEA